MPISFSSVTSRDAVVRGHGVTAVLGPTNTSSAKRRLEGMQDEIAGLDLPEMGVQAYPEFVQN